MKPNYCILWFVLAVSSVITAAVALVHPRPPRVVERVAPRGAPTEREEAALVVAVNRDGLSFTFKNCDMTGYQDKFFVHVFPATVSGERAREFINLDFRLSDVSPRKMATAREDVCIVDRAFGTNSPKEVVVGQFSMPEGRCCDILWSRSYLLGE